jgi:CSLREA domain-containing protein
MAVAQRFLFGMRRFGALVAVLTMVVGALVVVGPAPVTDAMPAPIQVTTTADVVDFGDGFCSLREAIGAANGGLVAIAAGECAAGNAGLDIIELAPGATYVLASSLPLLDDEPLTIEGNDATIDGDDNATLLFAAVETLIKNVTLTGGSGGATPAGALYVYGGPITLDGVTVTENRANQGGGITVEEGELFVTNGSVISQNVAAGFGGGIAIYNGDVTVTDSQIIDNRVATATDQDVYGGGIAVDNGGSIAVIRTLVGGNSVGGRDGYEAFGGGIGVESGRARVTDSTISGNTVGSVGGTIGMPVDPLPRGGGIAVQLGTLDAANTFIAENEANNNGLGGGIYAGLWSSTVLDGTSVIDNVGGTDQGGGIYHEGPLEVTDSIISEHEGGGIFNASSTLTLTDTLVADNQGIGIATSGTGTFTGTRVRMVDGAVALRGGTIELTASGIEGHDSVVRSATSIKLDRSTIQVPAASFGISLSLGNAELVNTTVAGDGSGAQLLRLGTGLNARVVNSTLSGGEVLVDSGATFAFAGSILNEVVDLGGTVTSNGFNVVGTYNSVGFNATDLVGVGDLGLLPLSLNAGGTTLTHDLSPTSPARDFVTSNYGSGVATPAVDQNETMRPQGAFPDAGAVESAEFVLPIVFCDGKQVTINMVIGMSGTGTNGDDVILGTDGADTIQGLAGDDTICGQGGDDQIDGGDGKDFIFGGEGNDTMRGGLGNDRIRGQQGVDTIHGEAGNDFLYGGIEGDTITGGVGRDTIGGFGGADIIDAGPGNDLVFGGFGPDRIDGGEGNDELRGLIGDDIIHGGTGDDTIFGDNGQDQVFGDEGNDEVNGGNSLDMVFGNEGNDVLNGGKANDTLSGGIGMDTCTGNLGIDTADSTCERTFGVP